MSHINQRAEILNQRQEEARSVANQDYFAARACLANCRDTGLTKAETEMVASTIAAASEIDLKVLRALNREVSNEHPEHGAIDDAAALEQAFGKEFLNKFGLLKVTNGDIYAYQGDEDHEEFGSWKRLPDDIFERIGIESFRAGISERATMRREAKRRFFTTREDPLAFADPTTGVALDNGFLRYNEVEQSLELVQHSPDHLARNKINVRYNPEARTDAFEGKLLRAFGGDAVKMAAFVEFLACAIFGTRPRNDSVRTCLTLFGNQRTGKSALLSFARLFFRTEQICSLSPELFGKPERDVVLSGKSINVVTELHPGKKISGAASKRIHSGELINGRHLYANLISFTPNCMHFFACNAVPIIDETDRSLQRRYMFISMGPTLSEAEASSPFDDFSEDEEEGIIELIARSLVNVMQRGSFILPADSNDLVSRMQFGSDIAALFARVRLEGKPGTRLTSEEIKEKMRDFAEEIGAEPDDINDGTMKRLSGCLKREWGVVRRKSNGRPFYEGVTFKGGSPTTARRLPRPGAVPPGSENAEVVGLADM